MKNFAIVVVLLTFLGFIVFGGHLIQVGIEMPDPPDGSARTPVGFGFVFMVAGAACLTITSAIIVGTKK